jgi:hypothetical protein
MEEERRSDPERVPLALELPVVTARHAGPSSAGEQAGAWAEVERGMPGPGPGPGPVAPAPGRRRRTHWPSRRHGAALAGVATVVLAGTGGLLSLRAPESPAEILGAVAASGPRGTGGEGGVRDGARVGFLRRVAGLRDQAGLVDVPAVWLEGRYLSDAAAHPGVRDFWEGVRGFVDAARRNEAEMYREAWLEAAEDLGVSGPVRSLRLATALGDFAAAWPVREAHYRRVGELAAAALALHDILVELGDRVTYEPMRGARLSADPVLEAAGADPAAQAFLETALDRVLAALRGPEGDSLRDRARLAEWMGQVPI